jgi:hypothetical protein
MSGPGLIYAQRAAGRKMHLALIHGDGEVERRALCGIVPDERGGWRMTCNVSLAHACKRCRRVWDGKPIFPKAAA